MLNENYNSASRDRTFDSQNPRRTDKNKQKQTKEDKKIKKVHQNLSAIHHYQHNKLTETPQREVRKPTNTREIPGLNPCLLDPFDFPSLFSCLEPH